MSKKDSEKPPIKYLRWLDNNIEKVMMNGFYSYMVLVVFIEVITRFVFKFQTSWGGVTAVHAFLWLSWLGCSWGIRTRSHLRFPGVRSNMSHGKQFICFLLDDVVWMIIAVVVLISSIKLLALQVMIGQTIEGTDNIPQWIATLSVPFGFSLVIIRAIQDIFINIGKYRNGEEFMPSLDK